jgi:glycosyltransferase involved in cell wall biosynthesis
MNTKVSFIIPGLNEEEQIASLIDNIKMLNDKSNYEIIVSDGYGTYKTADIAERKYWPMKRDKQ